MGSTKTNTKKHHYPKRQTVQITSWVKADTRERIENLAKREGITVSATIAVLVERALQQNADMQYGALLRPIIQSAIRKEMQAVSNRQATLLVRNAFDAGQIRGIVTNILGRMPGVTPEILNEILDDSARTSKSRLVSRTPQLEDLIKEFESWFMEKNRKGQ
jgi:hypothetical protein